MTQASFCMMLIIWWPSASPAIADVRMLICCDSSKGPSVSLAFLIAAQSGSLKTPSRPTLCVMTRYSSEDARVQDRFEASWCFGGTDEMSAHSAAAEASVLALSEGITSAENISMLRLVNSFESVPN